MWTNGRSPARISRPQPSPLRRPSQRQHLLESHRELVRRLNLLPLSRGRRPLLRPPEPKSPSLRKASPSPPPRKPLRLFRRPATPAYRGIRPALRKMPPRKRVIRRTKTPQRRSARIPFRDDRLARCGKTNFFMKNRSALCDKTGFFPLVLPLWGDYREGKQGAEGLFPQPASSVR